jgi:hypothetical protein
VQEKVIYACVWAGSDVGTVSVHAPYNLCLRLLFELASQILVPFPSGASSRFDHLNLPCKSGTGYTIKSHVQRHAASTTSVMVCLTC